MVNEIDALFERKIKTIFFRLDFDQNGRIDNEDFESWCNKIAESGILILNESNSCIIVLR